MECIIPRRGLPVFKNRSRLPEGYTELSYIEGTGTQYINTGVAPSLTTIVRAEFDMRQGSVNKFLFGSCIEWKNNGFAIFLEKTTNPYYTVQPLINDQTPMYKPTIPQGFYSVYMDRYKVSVDGQEKTYSISSLTSSVPLHILTNKVQNTTPNEISEGKIKSFSIENEGVVVRDLVPCINPQNQVGMYDLVSEQFFGNAGTGNFIAGDPV